MNQVLWRKTASSESFRIAMYHDKHGVYTYVYICIYILLVCIYILHIVACIYIYIYILHIVACIYIYFNHLIIVYMSCIENQV